MSVRKSFVIQVAHMTCLLVMSAALMGAGWSISQPTSGSMRSTTSNVSGNGDAPGNGGNATFCFGTNSGTSFTIENSISVSATGPTGGKTWSGDIPAPTGGWDPSPEQAGMPGMYEGDHTAWIEWVENSVTKRDLTTSHVVIP